MLIRDAPVVEPNREDLYISLYGDGVYRQRCGVHLHEAVAPLAFVWKKQRASQRHGCVVCREERKGGEGDVAVIEDVE